MASKYTIGIVGLYASDGEAELEANENVLRKLANILQGGKFPVDIELLVTEEPPAPYETYLSEVRFLVGDGELQSWVEGRCLLFCGSVENITSLGDGILWLAEQEGDECHLHVDYYPEHPYLSRNSISLVIAKR